MKAFINIIYLIILIVASIGLGGVSLYMLIQVIKGIRQIIINAINNIDEYSDEYSIVIGIIALTLNIIVVIMFIGIWVYYITETL